MAIPLVATSIVAAISAAAVPLVRKVLIGLGVTLPIFAGIQILLDQFEQLVVDQFSLLPETLVQAAGVMQLDVCISIILSSIVARATISGVLKATTS